MNSDKIDECAGKIYDFFKGKYGDEADVTYEFGKVVDLEGRVSKLEKSVGLGGKRKLFDGKVDDIKELSKIYREEDIEVYSEDRGVGCDCMTGRHIDGFDLFKASSILQSLVDCFQPDSLNFSKRQPFSDYFKEHLEFSDDAGYFLGEETDEFYVGMVDRGIDIVNKADMLGLEIRRSNEMGGAFSSSNGEEGALRLAYLRMEAESDDVGELLGKAKVLYSDMAAVVKRVVGLCRGEEVVSENESFADVDFGHRCFEKDDGIPDDDIPF